MSFPEVLEYGTDKLTKDHLRRLRDRVGYHVKVTFENGSGTARYRIASASSYGARLLLDEPNLTEIDDDTEDMADA